MILFRPILDACLVYDFEMPVKRLNHLFDIVWTSVHKLIRKESFTLLLDALVHFIGLFHVLKIVLSLIVLLCDIVQLFLPLYELFMDVSPESIVGTGQFLTLGLVLLPRMSMLLQHITFFFVYYC